MGRLFSKRLRILSIGILILFVGSLICGVYAAKGEFKLFKENSIAENLKSKKKIAASVAQKASTVQSSSAVQQSSILQAATTGSNEPPIIPEQLHYGEAGVNPGSGNFSFSCNDMSMPGGVDAAKFTRTYNSEKGVGQEGYDYFGRGWSFGYDAIMLKEETKTDYCKDGEDNIDLHLSVCLPNGKVCGFSYYESGSKIPQLPATIYAIEDRTILSTVDNTITTEDGTIYKFGVEQVCDTNEKEFKWFNDVLNKYEITGYQYYKYCKYNLISITYRNGNTVNIEGYRKSNNDTIPKNAWVITGIKDSSGRHFTIGNSGDGSRITSITDDSSNTDPTKRRVVRYIYDGGKLTHIIDPNDNVTSYEYSGDILSKVTDNYQKKVLVLNCDSSGKVRDYTDTLGNKYTYAYNTPAVTKTSEIETATTVTDSDNRSTIYYSDKFYYTTQVHDAGEKDTYTHYSLYQYGISADSKINRGEISSTTDRNGNTTIYDRNSNGNVTKITNPDKSFKEQRYDSKKNLLKEVDEERNFTQYIYDANNNLLKKVQLKRPLTSAETIDSVNYDPVNDSQFAVTENRYTTKGTIVSLLSEQRDPYIYSLGDPTVSSATYHYNDDGTVSDIVGAADSEIPGNKTIQYHYNSMKLKDWEISPKGYKTEYYYDNNGLLEKTILKSGSYRSDGKDEVTRVMYDALGRKIKEVSPKQYDASKEVTSPVAVTLNGSTYTFQINNYTGDHGYRYSYYDNSDSKGGGGKLYQVKDPENNTTTYRYDKYGNVHEEVKPNNSVYIYDYDNINRLVKVSFKKNDDTTSTVETLEEYQYNITSNSDGTKNTEKVDIKHLKGSETSTTKYTYDWAGRVIKQENPDGGIVNTIYYKNGKVKSTTDASNTYKTYYKYDALGSLAATWAPVEDKSGTVYYGCTKTIYYDNGSKKKEYFSKDKETETEVLAELGNTDLNLPSNSNWEDYTYYKNGKLKAAADNTGRKTINYYDENYNLSKEQVYTDDKNSNIVEYLNDYRGKPTQKTVHVNKRDIEGNALDDTADMCLITKNSYDLNGNLETVILPGRADTEPQTYIYDNLNRKTGATFYCEDENGNLSLMGSYSKLNWEGKPLEESDVEKLAGSLDTTVFKIKTVYQYNRRGFLEKKTDAKGYMTLYDYDTAGRKTAEVSPKNTFATTNIPADIYKMSRTEFTYDKMGNLKTQIEKFYEKTINTDFTWKTTWVERIVKACSYDKNGNLKKELDACGFLAGTGTTDDDKINSGYGMEYTYTPSNKVEAVLDPELKAAGRTFKVKYAYDALGRKVNETSAKAANEKDTVVSYEYDDAKNTLTQYIKSDDGLDTNGTFLKSVKYDLTGNITASTDSNKNTITNEYNALGKVRKTIYPGDDSIAENTVNFQYDVYGNTAWQSDSTNVVSKYTYDRNSRVLSAATQKADGSNLVTTYTKYDSNGNKVSAKDGNLTETKYAYDEINRLKSSAITVSGIVQTTSYGYDENGNQTSVTDWLGNSTINIYDPINRLIEKKNQLTKSIQKLEYYPNNLQSGSYDAYNNKTEYIYDKDGRLTVTQDPKLNTAGQTYEPGKTSQEYDYAGNIASKFDGKHTVKYTYDLMNNLSTVTNEKDPATEYHYDLEGNLLTVKDGRGNVLTRRYNAANKVSRKIDNGGILGENSYDPARTEEYKYSADGSLQSVKDRNGKTTSYTYYPQGWLQEKSCGALKVSYKYYGNGNLKEMTDSTGTTTREYDELGRVTKKTVPGISTPFTYTYDITANVDPGYSAETSVDPLNNKVTKVYDKVGRLYQVTYDTNKTTTYSYYDNGSRKSVENDASKEVYVYYPNGLLDTLTNYKKSGGSLTVMDTYKYHYDAAKNLDWKEETINGVSKGRTNYAYDEVNRLKTVAELGRGVTTSYDYDEAGNRKTQSVTSSGNTTDTTYHYDDRNRLTGYTITLNGDFLESAAYLYDNNGNMTEITRESLKSADPNQPESIDSYALGEKSKTDIDVVYKYDDFNRLVTSVTGDKVVNYEYNGDGLRTAKTVNGVKTKYLYEYDKPVLELDENNTQKAFNVYGSNLLARKVGGETMCYLYNGHADVTALLGLDGTIKGTYYYDAFGNIVEQTGSVNNPIRYAGYQYDDETGLYYCNSRMYDPKIARFLQEDTVSGDPNDPLSLNLYTYSFNNPLKYSDPSGHWPDLSGIGNWISGAWDNVTGFAEEHPWITTAVVGAAFVGLGILTMGAAVPEELAIGGALTGTELGGMMLGSGLTLGGSKILGTELNDYLDDYTYNTPINEYAGSFADGFTTGALLPIGGGLSAGKSLIWGGVSAFEGSSVGQLVSTGNVDFFKSMEAGVEMAGSINAFHVGASINDSISKILTDSLSFGELKLPEISMPEIPKFEVPTFEMPKTDFNLGNSYSSIIDELNGIGIVRYGTPTEESFGGNGFTGFNRPVAGDNIGSDLRLTGVNEVNEGTSELTTRVSEVRTPIPGDADYIGNLPPKSWSITESGDGCHMIERVNVRNRPDLAHFDTENTPRFYPDTAFEDEALANQSRGIAHQRLHVATKEAGIRLQGGNPNLPDTELLQRYNQAYSNQILEGIRGSIRTPDSSTVLGTSMTPQEAFNRLLEWGQNLER